jgi:hypothetical protein
MKNLVAVIILIIVPAWAFPEKWSANSTGLLLKGNESISCLVNSGYNLFTVSYMYWPYYDEWTPYPIPGTIVDDIQKAGGQAEILIMLNLRTSQAQFVASLFKQIPIALYGMVWINLAFSS